MKRCAFVSLGLAAGVPKAAWAAVSSWVPRRHVGLIIPTKAAGSLDAGMRMIQQIIQQQRLIPVASSVENKPGAGHALAEDFLKQQTQNPYYLAIDSPALLTSHLIGRTDVSLGDITPVALMFTEYLAFAVRADSPLRTLKDLVTRLHAQPGSLSIGLSSARGGTHDILFGLLMKSAKIPLKGIRVVAFSTTGGAIVQALGGHVDVIVATASPLRPLMSAGKMRALAVSSEKRLDGAPFASVPTCLEEGYDASFSNWRVIIAPPQLTSAQTDYWASVMREVLDSRPFRDYMSRFAMVPDYRTRSQLRDFLASQNSRFTDVLSFLGMIPAR